MGSYSPTMPSYHTNILAIISIAIPSHTMVRNLGDYPACMQDSDCSGLGGGYRCFQYMCYPWEQGGSLEKCQVKEDCKGKVGGEDGECGDGRYLAALGDMQCQDDSLCRELLLGDLCCYDVSTPPHSWQGEGGTHNLTRKCCQNDHDAPVIPPLDSVDQSHLSMIDEVLSKLEEFEITKLYCLVFSNEMRNKMPSCNSSSSSSGSATTPSITGIVATLALIVISL